MKSLERSLATTLFTLFSSIAALSSAAERPAALEFERTVAASPERVWQAWTTATGVQTFFSRDAVVDTRVDGEYSILFLPRNPPGQRGAEGMRILVLEPEAGRLVFSWSAPPHYPAVRTQRSFVEVTLGAAGDGATRVQLRHFGWGTGEEWLATRDYFAGAWEVVLNRLEYRFARGPVDWDRIGEIDGLLYSGEGSGS